MARSSATMPGELGSVSLRWLNRKGISNTPLACSPGAVVLHAGGNFVQREPPPIHLPGPRGLSNGGTVGTMR